MSLLHSLLSQKPTAGRVKGTTKSICTCRVAKH